MKKLIYSLLLWLTATTTFAQVTGNAQLMGETDHSGIKVLFTAVSPTAKTDSTVTDVNGNYSKTLTAGTYSIKFSKTGYYDSTYKQILFVNGVVKLNSIQLISKKIVFVSGNVSGTWDKSHLYIIKGDVIAIDSLVVLPGTRILIDTTNNARPGSPINFMGKIKLNGELGDSIYIQSLSNKNSSSIEFYYPDDFVELRYLKSTVYTKVGYYKTALTSKKDFIENCSFSAFSYLISGNSAIIQNNTCSEFATFIINQIVYNNVDISCNSFNYKINNSDFNPNGCYFVVNDYLNPFFYQLYGETINIHDNILSFDGAKNGKSYLNSFNSNQTSTINDERFNLTSRDSLENSRADGVIIFKNNFVKNYPSEIKIQGKNVFVEGNTFVSNLTQNIVINKRSKIKNNIFGKISLINRSNSGAFFNYNQYDFNSKFVGLSGAGISITKNSQGSNIDTYLNVIEDPQFTTVPLLSNTSPMLGAGFNGSNIGFDPFGTCLESYFTGGGNYHYRGDTLSISGKVYVSGVSNVEAVVKAVNVLSHREFTGVTDNAGNFVVDSLPLGNYYLVTTPINSMASLFETTYYPKRATVQLADTINVAGDIINMRVYMLSKTVGLDEEENQFESQVYPNPFKNQLVIENKTNEMFTITDISGRIKFESQQASETIDTQSWNQGLYFVKINNKVLKFVKE